jgi:hypothetical protein
MSKLYHQTDAETAEVILRTQRMKPGSGGLAGGGIYFATTPELTGHKAHKKGVILEATVALGKIHTLDAAGDPTMTLQKLKSMGFDSVCIARAVSSGHEYVVYDPGQVQRINALPRSHPAILRAPPEYTEGELATALRNYEDFHRLPIGSATVEQLQSSSAQIGGWLRASSSTEPNGLLGTHGTAGSANATSTRTGSVVSGRSATSPSTLVARFRMPRMRWLVPKWSCRCATWRR